MSAVRSIRRELVVLLALGLVALVAIAATATYLRARAEANELFDHQLRETAASLAGVPLTGVPISGAATGLAARDDELVLQIWDRNGVRIFLSRPQQELPQYAQLGFNNVATETGEWRVFSLLAGERVLQVAQPMRARRELAASMALRTIVPLIAIVPLVALLVWFGIARGLRPLREVASAVAARSPRSLDPVDEAGMPAEIRPLVRALNGLLGRLDRAQGAQRAFIADAAHELRTPLTAVDLQAQLAERASTEAERGAALAALKMGLARATHLVEQLLALAREEPGVTDRPMAPVNLGELARSVVAEHGAMAAGRSLPLEFAAADDLPGSTTVTGDAAGLRVLLGNLVDNALRYTPVGGRIRVDVARTGGEVAVSVRDSGPGIDPDERSRVFDRFYRVTTQATAGVPGSGLGLAIVKRIADRHDATIELGAGLASAAGEGLGVTLRFAAAT
jgi:two-component system OmpR family sensor kinase